MMAEHIWKLEVNRIQFFPVHVQRIADKLAEVNESIMHFSLLLVSADSHSVFQCTYSIMCVIICVDNFGSKGTKGTKTHTVN